MKLDSTSEREKAKANIGAKGALSGTAMGTLGLLRKKGIAGSRIKSRSREGTGA
jgi:hypothetical protein